MLSIFSRCILFSKIENKNHCNIEELQWFLFMRLLYARCKQNVFFIVPIMVIPDNNDTIPQSV
jgi:hypothetical protein